MSGTGSQTTERRFAALTISRSVTSGCCGSRGLTLTAIYFGGTARAVRYVTSEVFRQFTGRLAPHRYKITRLGAKAVPAADNTLLELAVGNSNRTGPVLRVAIDLANVRHYAAWKRLAAL